MPNQIIVPFKGDIRYYPNVTCYPRADINICKKCVADKTSWMCIQNKEGTTGLDRGVGVCLMWTERRDLQRLADMIIINPLRLKIIHFAEQRLDIKLVNKKTHAGPDRYERDGTLILHLHDGQEIRVILEDGKITKKLRDMIVKEAQIHGNLEFSDPDLLKNEPDRKMILDELESIDLEVTFGDTYQYNTKSMRNDILTHVYIRHPWCGGRGCLPYSLTTDCTRCPVPHIRGLIHTVRHLQDIVERKIR